MKYVVLRAAKESYGIETALVEWGTYLEDGGNPSDYFKPALADHAVKVGEVDIVGDDDDLDPVYTSE